MRMHWSCKGLLLVVIQGLSTTVVASIADPQVERLDERHVAVTWVSTNPVDVYAAEGRDTGVDRAKRLSQANRRGRYVASVTDGARSYFLIRDAVDGQVVRVSERALSLEQGSNFRDLGGYQAVDGRRVRWGLIYRSGGMPLLTDRDIAHVRALDLRATIDLRSTEERELAPSRLAAPGFGYVAVDYPLNDLLKMRDEGAAPHAGGTRVAPETALYRGFLTRLAPQYQGLFRTLLSNPGATAFNCTAGQDRTGVAAALVLLALGVPRETILEDYHLSTIYRHPQFESPAIDPTAYPANSAAPLLAEARKHKPTALRFADGRPFLADTFDAIDAQWGSVDRYLRQELGVTPADLGALREKYLECMPPASAACSNPVPRSRTNASTSAR